MRATVNDPAQQATAHGKNGATGPLRVLLISTYDLGRQPFSLASPAAWLVAEGAVVETADLAAEQLQGEAVRRADLIALSVPMHTATRLALHHLPALRAANPAATICCFGLYAAMNEQALRNAGAEFVLAGEFEAGLVQVARLVTARQTGAPGTEPPPAVSTARQQFLLPDRGGLPPLDKYARLVTAGGERLVGATEATRGCKHLCRHCPIVPVYNGRFRVVQRDVVLADIRQQVQAGATHITFGDPDFFNAPAHSTAIVSALHEEFPSLSYDVTIKVEHLVKHARLIPVLQETGCLFVTSAVEGFDEQTLAALEKHHTMAEFVAVVEHFRAVGLHLSPTFVPFTPWTTPQTYLQLLTTIADLGLVDSVAQVQYAIRLLIPAGSRILELPLAQACIGGFDPDSLAYPWAHPDPAVDRLHAQVLDVVDRAAAEGTDRRAVFAGIWARAVEAAGDSARPAPALHPRAGTIPHLTEPWYCCAEPTERQLAQSLDGYGSPPGGQPGPGA
jgi:radical SAM family protein